MKDCGVNVDSVYTHSRLRPVRKGFLLSMAALLAAVACTSAQSPLAPSPPQPRPNSTALEGLHVVQALERDSGRQSILVYLTAAGVDNGRVTPGGLYWAYQFALENSNDPSVHEWRVYWDGRVEDAGTNVPILRLDYTDLTPHLALDSDAVVAIGLQNGGRRVIEQFPTSTLTWMTCYWIGLRPTWRVGFWHYGGPECSAVVAIDAHSGEVLFVETQGRCHE